MFKLKTAATGNVISLTEAKRHLRLIGSDEFTPVQSIAPASHAVTVVEDVDTPLEGTAVDLLGYYADINLSTGTCAGTLTVKVYHRNHTSDTWVLWESFAAVTAADDNATFNKTYDGGLRYIMPKATIATNACYFGVDIIKQSPVSAEDAWITEAIEIIQQQAERYQGRDYLETVYELYLDEWPSKDYIEIEKAPIQSVDSITYTDSDGTESTFAATLYFVDTNQFWPRICLEYGESWPSDILLQSGAIKITLTAGYETAAAFKVENKTEYQWMLAALYQLYYDRSLTIDDISHKALEFKRTRGRF